MYHRKRASLELDSCFNKKCLQWIGVYYLIWLFYWNLLEFDSKSLIKPILMSEWIILKGCNVHDWHSSTENQPITHKSYERQTKSVEWFILLYLNPVWEYKECFPSISFKTTCFACLVHWSICLQFKRRLVSIF